MKRFLLSVCIALFCSGCKSQGMVAAADKFIGSLDAVGKQKALYPFDTAERYNFHFFPKDDRKGISLNELTPVQRQAAMGLLKSCLSESGQQKALDIMHLEAVLKLLENRKEADRYRDSGKYYFILFGRPDPQTIWGWRLEGHHLSFTFSAEKNRLVSGTPAFMGTNPAIVPIGAEKGKQVLKEEADQAFALLHSLSGDALQKALIDTTAPNEILTFVSRNAVIGNTSGLRYSEMTAAQQEQLLALIRVYVHRYTRLFAAAMFKEIETAGLDNIRFAWAGATQPRIGKAHYYRITGPTFIIEYDNSQNNANHVHSVLRDLKNDFGGDVLLEHYKAAH
jgi:hypothetical protein